MHAPAGAVYDSCTESEPPGSKDNSLRAGGAFQRSGRRSGEGSLRAGGAYPGSSRCSREGSLRAGRVFGRCDGADLSGVMEDERAARRPSPRSRSFGALLAEAAAVLRGAAHGGFSVGSPRQQDPRASEPCAGPSPRSAPARMELQPRAVRTVDATSPHTGRTVEAASALMAPAHQSVTPPQEAGAPARDLPLPRLADPALGQTPSITLSHAWRAPTPGGSASASEAQSTAGTSASRLTSLASMVSGLASAHSDPAPAAAGPPGAWPLAAAGSVGPLVRLSAEVAAALDARPAQWQQVCPPAVLL